MSLPQIDAALAACGRRDADHALMMLRVVHNAHAPLIVGKPGWDNFEVLERSLRKALYGEEEVNQKSEDDVLARMKADGVKE